MSGWKWGENEKMGGRGGVHVWGDGKGRVDGGQVMRHAAMSSRPEGPHVSSSNFPRVFLPILECPLLFCPLVLFHVLSSNFSILFLSLLQSINVETWATGSKIFLKKISAVFEMIDKSTWNSSLLCSITFWNVPPLCISSPASSQSCL